VAVPANMQCGQTELADQVLAPTWAPLRYTYAGINEVDPDWVAEHAEELKIIDVREQSEFTGLLGHIPGATLIPLEQLREHAASLSPEEPVIMVCRSGARSAQGVTILEKAGFTKVANLTGGMINWNNHRLTVSRTA